MKTEETHFFAHSDPKASIRAFTQPTSVGFFSSGQDHRTRYGIARSSWRTRGYDQLAYGKGKVHTGGAGLIDSTPFKRRLQVRHADKMIR